MKVLLVSTSDLEGGAARSTYRLLQGLKRIQADAQLLVQMKESSDRSVIGAKSTSGIANVKSGIRLTLDHLLPKFYRHSTGSDFSPQWLPGTILNSVSSINPDVINLHWIQNGYIQIEALKQLKKPIVWTLHDMWAFTGGCHYTEDCTRYLSSCGQCPQLGSHQAWDMSRWNWQRKAATWSKLNLTIATPSRWLADCARSSSLLREVRVEWIPYGIDTEHYKPFDRTIARQILGLSQDKKLILCGALGATSQKRKGFHLLQAALQSLGEWRDRAEVIIFGANEPENPPDLGLKSRYLGTLGDDYTLALVYSAADVFVAPSLQDNLPNTVIESLACGTPAIGFNIGGFPDLIEHQQNGYLAQAYDVDDLAQGIVWILEDAARQQQLSDRAREKAEQEFTLERQAQQYQALYAELVGVKAV
ncbi:MAG: glycosyltransferase family 4 protein [Leptolyngbya sp. Prado105]|jgi:glycosyltransferase involved in cell wall biosynthesis|nr:glycosyltransferase family 4 protein [Leptolyngbya sp. Prado105]